MKLRRSYVCLSLGWALAGTGPLSAQAPPEPLPTIAVPPEVERILRDYEQYWRKGDPFSGEWVGVCSRESFTWGIIDLNRRIMHQQIIERDPALFDETSLDEFLVVAPGGRIENKTEAMGGVNAWDASSIEVRDEQVIFHGNTAVLIGRLQIDGVMRPVGSLPPLKFMAAFVETGGQRKLLARSLTPCFQMAIEHGFC